MNPAAAPSRRPAGRGHLILGALLLAMLTVLAYAPALTAGFIWDDDNFLTRNALIRGGDGLRRLWLTTQSPDYWPLTSTTLWVEWRLWGMNAAGYHTTNVVLHIAETLLLWSILRRLRIPGAFLASLLFALHPVNVESVAWITQRKNLVAMLFFLLSIRCFLETDPGAPPGSPAPPRARLWFGLGLLAFALAQLGKGSVAPLPLVLLGIVGWRRRVTVGDWIYLAPFFGVAAVFTLVNLWFQANDYAPFRHAGFVERMLGAAAAIWFYLGKAAWPVNLCFVYPSWSIHPGEFRWWIPLLAAGLVTAGLWHRGWRRDSLWWRGTLFAWLYFCVMLAPVLGFTDVGFMVYSLVADHYQHLAIIGVATWGAAALVTGLRGLPSAVRPVGWALCALLVAVLGVLTQRQSGIYQDVPTLFRATLERNPACWMAHNNLAVALANIPGRRSEALAHYTESLRLNPDNAEAHNNLAVALAKMPGRMPDALDHYAEALRLRPLYPDARNNLANAQAASGRISEALANYEEALRLNPNFAEAHYGMANALMRIPGRLPEALAHYEAAVRLNPDNAEAQNNLGVLCGRIGRYDEAISHFELALRLDPSLAGARENLKELRATRR